MTHRKHVEIKTKYQTKNECLENCRDIKKSIVLPIPFSRKIYGQVFDDYTFTLSSRGKTGAVALKYVGHIESRDDGIYMSGDITVKPFYKILLYVLGISFILAGVFITLIGMLYLQLVGILLIAIGWYYIFLLTKSDILYRDLIKKSQ